MLFQNNLSPNKENTSNPSLYGINIDLTEIKNEVKSVADYESALQSLTVDKEKIFAQTGQIEKKLNSEIERLRNRLSPKIKAHKERVHELAYLLEQSRTQQQKSQLMLEDLKTKASETKQQKLIEIDEDINSASDSTVLSEETLTKIEAGIKGQIRTKEKERDEKIAQALISKNAKESEIEALVKNKEREAREHSLALDKQLGNELAGKGADTGRLGKIKTQLSEIETELIFIDQNTRDYHNYFKDKEELFDKNEFFKNQKQLTEKQLQQEAEKHARKKNELGQESQIVENQIKILNERSAEVQQDKEAFEKFQLSDAYTLLQKDFVTEQKNERSARLLIEELTGEYYKGIQLQTGLNESVNKLIGQLSSSNIFRFNTSPTTSEEFRRFAETLDEFVENNKIAEFERRFNERFADIIKLIGNDTTLLLSKENEIRRVINDINQDFVVRNFAGVIKSIELRLESSANRVVSLLSKIKDFNAVNAYSIGVVNLFSGQDQETSNQKAIDLLKQLVKEIVAAKSDFISLSDSFELQFRVKENENDTGWVEKLANVGSEGTDVLVKAMINVMLLNVFKEGASKRFRDFQLHCMMDEIGKLHPTNVRGILQFANERNIMLINSSPTENDALAYKQIYKLEKDAKNATLVKRILTQYSRE